ncbi:DUF3048 domain-containing protein [Brevibacillus sp. TJ4]|uniref:DUF3048 domain-containing protein n=1 Tax=Brevibacillus sp. TJ4 TaxID=3234853 RepID=UPI003B9DC5D4
MQRYLPSFLVLLVTLALLTACTGKPVENEPDPTPDPPPAPTVETPGGKTPTFPYTAPLTGLGSHTSPDQRPVMVMINNAPQARPQSGINQADIVYEVLAEGEMTRFLTVFQSQKPEVIGPVRSIRSYFIELGSGFEAVLIHSGGSPDALATLSRSRYSHLDEIPNGKYFWREQFRKAPHNLYTKYELLEQAIADKNMRETSEPIQLRFLPEDAVISDGDPATKIEITFHSLNKAMFQYDSEEKKYLRFTNGDPHFDLADNKQLSATNLLVIASRHRVVDSEGRREVDVAGPGDGYLFQQGKVQKIKWKRSNGVIRAYKDEQLTEELPLLPGQTWVEIVPNSQGLDQHVKYE